MQKRALPIFGNALFFGNLDLRLILNKFTFDFAHALNPDLGTKSCNLLRTLDFFNFLIG